MKYLVNMRQPGDFNALSWAFKNIGKRFVDWDFKVADENIYFYFKHEEDEVKFILKWYYEQ